VPGGSLFGELLDRVDAPRVTEVIAALFDHGLRFGLTGSLAIEAQLLAHGRPVSTRQVNDIDLVVESFESIPQSLAGHFLQHHVHPEAADGRTLLQLIDTRHRLRVDLFGALGATLSRVAWFDGVALLSSEDLIARTTALVCGRLGRGRCLDPKHAVAFRRLRELGQHERLAQAWDDHRQQIAGTIGEASREAERLLDARAQLLVPDEYSAHTPPCARCRTHGAFRPAPRERIVAMLGYC
jgi:hypothetical protein